MKHHPRQEGSTRKEERAGREGKAGKLLSVASSFCRRLSPFICQRNMMIFMALCFEAQIRASILKSMKTVKHY